MQKVMLEGDVNSNPDPVWHPDQVFIDVFLTVEALQGVPFQSCKIQFYSKIKLLRRAAIQIQQFSNWATWSKMF